MNVADELVDCTHARLHLGRHRSFRPHHERNLLVARLGHRQHFLRKKRRPDVSGPRSERRNHLNARRWTIAERRPHGHCAHVLKRALNAFNAPLRRTAPEVFQVTTKPFVQVRVACPNCVSHSAPSLVHLQHGGHVSNGLVVGYNVVHLLNMPNQRIHEVEALKAGY